MTTALSELLLNLLVRGPKTWTELEQAGLDRDAALLAVGALVAAGDYRIRLGPIIVEIEEGPTT
jgi:hypothetical protein